MGRRKQHELPYRNLRLEIMRAGFSRDDLSELTGISKTTFSFKITGKSQFTVSEAVRIKKILESDLPLEELFKL